MKSILIIWVLTDANGWVIDQQIPVDACVSAPVAPPQQQYYTDQHHHEMRAAVCYDLKPPTGVWDGPLPRK
jgi:hypothetical protein